MPFSRYSLSSITDIVPDAFVKNISIWSHQTRPIGIALCHFDKAYFTEDLFRAYKISAPQSISKAVNKRKAEFLAGRIAAREALKTQIDVKARLDITIANNGAPCWPHNTTGSISHNASFSAAIVGSSCHLVSFGIDIEEYLDERTHLQISGAVHNTAEESVLTSLGFDRCQATTIIFSAKETLYKAIHKYVNEFFGFECARVVQADLLGRTLQIKLEESFWRKHKLQPFYSCQFTEFNKNIMTLIELPQPFSNMS